MRGRRKAQPFGCPLDRRVRAGVADVETEGFIHCSFAEQLDAVLDRYYNNAGDVLILSVETEKLTSPLVNEASTNNDIYPHIYGPINRDAIVGVDVRRKHDR